MNLLFYRTECGDRVIQGISIWKCSGYRKYILTLSSGYTR